MQATRYILAVVNVSLAATTLNNAQLLRRGIQAVGVPRDGEIVMTFVPFIRKQAFIIIATIPIFTGCLSDDTPVLIKQTEMDFRALTTDGDAEATVVVHRSGYRPAEEILDPNIDTPYDSDMIVLNRQGQPFLSIGDFGQPLNPETGNRYADWERADNQVAQVEDLQLALRTLTTLRERPGVGVTYKWELRSLYYLATKTLAGINDISDGTIVPEETPSGPSQQSDVQGEVGKSQWALGAGPPYTHVVTIWYKPLYWTAWQGDHSAVLLRIFDKNGTWQQTISTRNHGREASDPIMDHQAAGCPKAFSNRPNAIPEFQTYVSTDTWGDGDAGGCYTPYDAVYPTTGGHVCNDDTYVEYESIKLNAFTGTWSSTCGDSDLRLTAPGCF
ncbi:MAG: hypothetical protein RLZZ324_170 [Candidatus Parcubacteria bacterium]|jgi:hypothetical protein